MAAVPITVPGVGESITEGILRTGSSPTAHSSRPESRSSSSRPTRPAPSFRPVRRASSRSPSRRARPWPSVPRSAHLTPPPLRLRLRHPPGAGCTLRFGVRTIGIAPGRAAAAASSNDGAAAEAAVPLAPSVRRLVAENQIDPSQRRCHGQGRADHQGRCADLPSSTNASRRKSRAGRRLTSAEQSPASPCRLAARCRPGR